MRFDDRVTGNTSAFAPHARIIHIDIEPSQIGRNVPTEVGLPGDAKAVLTELLPLLNHSDHSDWVSSIKKIKEEHPSLAIPKTEKLLAQHVLKDLNDIIQNNPNTNVVTGVGQHQMWAAQFLFLDKFNTFISSGGLGAMGFEIPAALGAQVAAPDSTVWTIAGDGGFQMTLQELMVLAQENLPVKIVLLNNGVLGMVKQWQEMYFDGHLNQIPMPGPDYVKLSESYGIPAVRVTEQEDVSQALLKAQEHNGPYLIEFVIDPSVNVFPMVPPGGSLPDTIEDPLTSATSAD